MLCFLSMFCNDCYRGLDSASTLQIVSLLKSLARGGRNIICTVHQPSASSLALFDHMYIIGNGYCVYQGSSANMLPFLQSVGLPCPQYHNPADFSESTFIYSHQFSCFHFLYIVPPISILFYLHHISDILIPSLAPICLPFP